MARGQRRGPALFSAIHGIVYAACARSVIADCRAALAERDFGEAWAAGSRLTLDEAVSLVRRSRGARRRPAVGWGSLTPTELEVVRLVIDGLSDPQIGSRLFVNRGTVKTHLSHVHAKLGLANRTELAIVAATHFTNGGWQPPRGLTARAARSTNQSTPARP